MACLLPCLFGKKNIHLIHRIAVRGNQHQEYNHMESSRLIVGTLEPSPKWSVVRHENLTGTVGRTRLRLELLTM
jgi:hypothetical protein